MAGYLAKFEIYIDEEKKWRWRLVRNTANESIILAVSGDSYKSHKECVSKIAIVKKCEHVKTIYAKDTLTNKGDKENGKM